MILPRERKMLKIQENNPSICMPIIKELITLTEIQYIPLINLTYEMQHIIYIHA